MTNKRILTLLLAMVMVISMIPVNAFGAEAEVKDITKTGLDLIKEKEVLPDEKPVNYKAGEGTCTVTKHVDEKGNLTGFDIVLNNAEIKPDDQRTAKGIRYYKDDVQGNDIKTVITVKGDNDIYDIKFLGNLDIKGEGKLRVGDIIECEKVFTNECSELNALVTQVKQSIDNEMVYVDLYQTAYGTAMPGYKMDMPYGNTTEGGFSISVKLDVPYGRTLILNSARDITVIASENIKDFVNVKGEIYNNDKGVLMYAEEGVITEEILKDSIKSLRLKGTGLVSVEWFDKDGNSRYELYTNQGIKVEHGERVVNVTLSDTENSVDPSGTYSWDAASRTLTLNNANVGEFKFPSDKPIVVKNNGYSSILTLNYVTGGTSPDITFTGNGTINIGEYNKIAADQITIDKGLEVAINDQIELDVDSKITVNGTLNLYCDSDGNAIVANQLEIGSEGVLNVLNSVGDSGIKLFGAKDKTFVLHKGGKIYVPSKESSIMIDVGSNNGKVLTREQAEKIFYVEEGTLPEGYEVKVLSEENGGTQYAITVADKDVTPVLEYGTVTGTGSIALGYGQTLTDYDSQWTRGTDKNLELHIDAELGWFRNVKVDGVVVDPENYELAEGSIIVRLLPSYLATLGDGAHTVTVSYTGGSSTLPFSIVAAGTPGGGGTLPGGGGTTPTPGGGGTTPGTTPTPGTGGGSSAGTTTPSDNAGTTTPEAPKTETPKTGDTADMMPWMVLALVAAGGVYFVKRKEN